MQRKEEAAATVAAAAAAVPASAGTSHTKVLPGRPLRLAVQRVDGSKATLALVVLKKSGVAHCVWQLTVRPRHAGGRRPSPILALESWLSKHGEKLTPSSRKHIVDICDGAAGSMAQAEGPARRHGIGQGKPTKSAPKSAPKSQKRKRVQNLQPKTESKPRCGPLLHRPAAKLRNLQELAAKRAGEARSLPLPEVDATTIAEGLRPLQPSGLRFHVRRADGSDASLALITVLHHKTFKWQMTTQPRFSGAERGTPLLALEAWLSVHKDKLNPDSFLELAGRSPPDARARAHSELDEATLEDGVTDDASLATRAVVPQPEEAAQEDAREEAELEDLVDTPPGLQTWSGRASLLNILRCPSDSTAASAVAGALFGAAAFQDLEELWRSQSHSPLREEGSPRHETVAPEEEQEEQQEDVKEEAEEENELMSPSEAESGTDDSEGLPRLSPDIGSDAEALMPGEGGGIFEVDPEEDELESGGQTGMLFVSADDEEA